MKTKRTETQRYSILVWLVIVIYEISTVNLTLVPKCSRYLQFSYVHTELNYNTQFIIHKRKYKHSFRHFSHLSYRIWVIPCEIFKNETETRARKFVTEQLLPTAIYRRSEGLLARFYVFLFKKAGFAGHSVDHLSRKYVIYFEIIERFIMDM